MSTFGLNIGVQGMSAQQRALEVTGHNIAMPIQRLTRQEAVMLHYTIKTNKVLSVQR